VDSTSAAITALIVAGEEPASPAVTNGLAYIKLHQADNGGFLSWGATNADTNSWAINAIVAAGQDPTSADWTKNGNTPVDDLLSFQQDDGSFYWQSDTPGAWPCQTTASAIPALLGRSYPVTLRGDFDGDGDMDIFDFVRFASAYGSGEGDVNYNPIGDFNHDGEINILDFVAFATMYGYGT